MCERKDDGLISVSLIHSRLTIAGGNTVTLPQRAGRVRITLTLREAGTVELWTNTVATGNALVFINYPSPPVVLDINHYGRIITGQLTVYNGDAGAHTVDVVEHIEAL